MKIVGIVCEFNPFHNGHQRLIDYAKNVLNADYIVAVMSGNFVQRGEPAILDKYSRAKVALQAGIDIVFEIPAIFSTSSAREYANCAVKMLSKCGIVDTILFGCETGDADTFIEYAKKIISAEKKQDFNINISKLQKKGLSFAEARTIALKETIDTDFISTPNNILGLEYTKTIIENNYSITLETLQRNNDYNSQSLPKDLIFASATAIRNALFNTENISKWVPNYSFKELATHNTNSSLIFPNDISSLLHYKLISTNDFIQYLDVDNDLNNKIKNNLSQYTNFQDFSKLLKSKDVAYTKIQRALCHILLDISYTDFNTAKDHDYISYLRMLGFSQNGSSILGLLKEKSQVHIITNVGKPSGSNNDNNLITDIKASDIYRSIITSKTGKALPTEYTQKYELCNI